MNAPFTVIIPARLAASRLPEKLLKLLGDKSVIEHTYHAAKRSQASRVVIAADDQRTVDVAKQFGAEVMLTDKAHESGTDRLVECVNRLNLADDNIIVNLQGDEPLMPAALINQCAMTLVADAAPMATVAVPIENPRTIDDPNAVKVIINQRGHAMYFSRAAIPFNRDKCAVDIRQHYFHHLGLYSYRAAFLKRYSQLPPSPLEALEKLEQLRVLDAGETIAVAIVDEIPPKGIDTAADLAAARQFIERKSSDEIHTI